MNYYAGMTTSPNDVNKTVPGRNDDHISKIYVCTDYDDIELGTNSTDNHTDGRVVENAPCQLDIITGKQMVTGSLSDTDRMRKEKQKRRGLFATLAVTALLVVAGGVTLLVMWRLEKIGPQVGEQMHGKVLELSEACSGSGTCWSNHSECGSAGFCTCSKGYYDTNGPRFGGTCARKVELNEPCPQPNACRDDNAMCYDNSTCMCEITFFDSNGFTHGGTCKREVGLFEPCSQSDVCRDSHAICGTNNICVCADYFYAIIHLVKGAFCKPIPCIESSTTYDGRVAVTISGRRCQAWDSTKPHIPNELFETFPQNFCRDFYGEGLPWCYTEDPGVKWEFCPIYTCQGSCLSKYTEYSGNINFTLSGRPCLNWNQIDVHLYDGWPKILSDDHNFCRDPNTRGRPWCFVNVSLYTSSDDPEWEFCPVPICSGKKDQPALPYSNIQYAKETSDTDAGVCYEKSTAYNGTRSRTTTGYMCQNWNTFTPNFHNIRDPSVFPDKSLDEARNYCRDPEDKGFTYCYIADSSTYVFEKCAITECTPVPDLCSEGDEKSSEMEFEENSTQPIRLETEIEEYFINTTETGTEFENFFPDTTNVGTVFEKISAGTQDTGTELEEFSADTTDAGMEFKEFSTDTKYTGTRFEFFSADTTDAGKQFNEFTTGTIDPGLLFKEFADTDTETIFDEFSASTTDAESAFETFFPGTINETIEANDTDVRKCIPRTNLALNYNKVWAYSYYPLAPPALAVDGRNYTYTVAQRNWWLKLPQRTPIKTVDVLIEVVGASGKVTLCVTVDEVPCECFPNWSGYGRKTVLCKPTLIGTFVHITQEPEEGFMFITEVEIYSVHKY